MPKRKSKRHDDFDYLSKKLKKLERKIKRSRRHDSVSSSDIGSPTPQDQQESELTIEHDDYNSPLDNPQPGCSHWDLASNPPLEEQILPITADLTAEQVETAPLLPIESNVIQQRIEGAEAEQSSATQPDGQELDPDVMEILGEDPTSINEYGPEIQKDLAIRLNHITTFGLSKENRKELKDKYLVPTNCKFIKAPVLNPEVRASLVESQAKRDKGIENKQVFTACALSSLSEAITHLLSSGHKDPKLLKLLMDSARILGDIQYMDSSSRRLFILSTLKKELKEQLEKTKIEDILFGNNLTDTLKSAKTIIKSGADLRSSSTMKSTVQRPAKPVNRPLNYRAPPANRRQPPLGGPRFARQTPSTPTARQPTRTTANNGSKTSSRQPPPRYRR